MGFASLQHLRRLEVHWQRAKPARYVPPSGFGYPLDGFRPRIPCRFCFAPAALLGFTLRRFPLPEGFRGLSAGKNPPTVNPTTLPTPKRQTGPRGIGFWVHTFRERLATARSFSPTTTGGSLGFRPSRVHLRKPWPELLRASPRVLKPSWRLLTGQPGTSGCLSALASPHPKHTEVHPG